MSQPEAGLRNAILDLLNLWRIKCWIFDSIGIFDPRKGVYLSRAGKRRVKGLPDIHGIIPGGRFFGIEVKMPGRYPSPDQKQQIAEINAAGGLAFIARSIKDVEERKPDFKVGHGL
jgi:hypothetical protein